MAQGQHFVMTDNDGAAHPGRAGQSRRVDLAMANDRRRLSTAELIGSIVHTVSLLVSKEIDLAREEAKADLKAELAVVKLLAIAIVGALMGLNLLLVAAVLGLAQVMPAWLAAIALGVAILVVSAVVGAIGWRRRVTRPLAMTRKAVEEDVRWVKERLA